MVDHTNQRSDDEDWYDFAGALKTLYYELPPSVQDHIGRRNPAVDAVFRCTRDLFKDRERFAVYARHAIGRLAESAAPVWTIDIDRVQIDRVTPDARIPTQPAAVIQDILDLTREVLPANPDAVIERLRTAIGNAQRDVPQSREEKEAFVESVNRLLDFLQYRIHLQDLGECKLIVRPGYKDKGYIQFQPASGGSFGPFENRKFTLVPKGSKN